MPRALQNFYPSLIETMIQTVKPDNIATFLGRKLNGNYQQEMGNCFNARWLGTRIKHTMGSASIKMYDKFNFILHLETTVSDVSFFKQYRTVQLRDGTETTKWATMKKTIYSLPALQESLLAANHRYLKFISEIQVKEIDQEKLSQLAETKEENQHRYKYYLTEFGRYVMLTVLKLREMIVIPQLGFATAC